MTRHLLSQLAHVELLSPKPAETVAFLEQVIGLEVSARSAQSVYMRCWGEFFHHDLKITESAHSGLGHIGWRADSADDLQEVARVLSNTSSGEGWHDGDQGHGPAYRFRSPNGHLNEVFWEVERWHAPPTLQTTHRNRPQKYTGRGAGARKLNHVTVSAANVREGREFYTRYLGFQYHEGAVFDGTDREATAFISVTHRSHDLGIVLDPTGASGRLNHIAFWLDTREEVLRAADLISDYNEKALEFGPGRHNATEGFFLYLREPGGNRIELFNGDNETLAPDQEPVVWRTSEHPTMYWTGDMPPSMYAYATPPIEVQQQTN